MKKLVCFCCTLAVIFCNWFTIRFCEVENPQCRISFDISAQVEDTFQCFYLNEEGEWSVTAYKEYLYVTPNTSKTLEYTFPTTARAFRIDTGNVQGNVVIANLKLSCVGKTIPAELSQFQGGSDGVGEISHQGNSLLVSNVGLDPYVIYKFTETQKSVIEAYVWILNLCVKILMLVALNAVFWMFIKKRSAVYSIISELRNSAGVVFRLSVNDLKSRFSSSFLGVIWAFVQPLMTILVFWFVFQVGLRNGDVGDVPFILWYAVAFVAWTFFSDTILSTTNCLREYGYLVRKIQFNVDIIPVVKVISGCMVHVLFIFFIFFLCFFYKLNLTIHCVQVLYYFACTVLLLLGLGWLLSSVSLFAGDVASCVGVIIQIGFWATPIVWNAETMSPVVQTVMKFNPMYYICNGYRDAFINQQWFWERGWINVYFWIIVLAIFLLGILLFRKLKKQFADVL